MALNRFTQQFWLTIVESLMPFWNAFMWLLSTFQKLVIIIIQAQTKTSKTKNQKVKVVEPQEINHTKSKTDKKLNNFAENSSNSLYSNMRNRFHKNIETNEKDDDNDNNQNCNFQMDNLQELEAIKKLQIKFWGGMRN